MTTGPGHTHGRRCYWDHLRCGWVCPPGPAPAPQETREAEQEDEQELVAAR